MESSPGSIDIRNILNVCRNGDALNTSLLTEILNSFIDENRRRVSDLPQALEAGRREAVLETAHAVRGSAAIFGAGRLHDLAWGVELDAMTSSHDELLIAIRAMHAELDAVIASLRHKVPPS